jgi:hypothetical protein
MGASRELEGMDSSPWASRGELPDLNFAGVTNATSHLVLQHRFDVRPGSQGGFLLHRGSFLIGPGIALGYGCGAVGEDRLCRCRAAKQ